MLSLLQDDLVHYNNQPIAVVVAERSNRPLRGYAASGRAIKSSRRKAGLSGGFATAHPGGHGQRSRRQSPPGSCSRAWLQAEVKIDEIYTTPMQTHNPMEPHATIAQWEGEKLTLHDATQYISGVKQTVARTLGIPEDNVRVICPYTGGGFGCKGSTWSHVVLAAMAAKVVNRPVKTGLRAAADVRSGRRPAANPSARRARRQA